MSERWQEQEEEDQLTPEQLRQEHEERKAYMLDMMTGPLDPYKHLRDE